MPQGNQAVAPSSRATSAAATAFKAAPQIASADGALLTGKGLKSVKNLTAAAVVQGGVGRIAKVSVIVAGSAAGTVNDVLTTGAAGVANQVAVIPNTVGVYDIDWPMSLGIVVVPGTGQTVAVSYQ